MLAAKTEPMTNDDYVAVLRKALDGDETTLRDLINLMTPVVHVRVARTMHRRQQDARGRDLRQDIEDLTQEVFAALFSKDAKALRAWDPERGLSFLNFVGFLAEREVAMRFRSAKRNPWTEDPATMEELNRAVGVTGCPEHYIESRDLLAFMLGEIQQWLTPEGRQYFQLLYVDQQSVADVAERSGTTKNALYVWRNRLLKKVRAVREQLHHDGGFDG